MIGGIFSKCFESCGDSYIFKKIKLQKNSILEKMCIKYNIPLYKKYIGSSTKLAQKIESKQIIKTSEGIIKYNKMDICLDEWIIEFEDYLRSAMSYTNCKTLYDFKGKVNFNIISQNAFKRMEK